MKFLAQDLSSVWQLGVQERAGAGTAWGKCPHAVSPLAALELLDKCAQKASQKPLPAFKSVTNYADYANKQIFL
jgi:hypothetical protein